MQRISKTKMLEFLKAGATLVQTDNWTYQVSWHKERYSVTEKQVDSLHVRYQDGMRVSGTFYDAFELFHKTAYDKYYKYIGSASENLEI